VVRVLVHVERQDRDATGERVGVVGSALPMATNSARQRSRLPKLASSASAMAGAIV
jgi:hypothetical protein